MGALFTVKHINVLFLHVHPLWRKKIYFENNKLSAKQYIMIYKINHKLSYERWFCIVYQNINTAICSCVPIFFNENFVPNFQIPFKEEESIGIDIDKYCWNKKKVDQQYIFIFAII